MIGGLLESYATQSCMLLWMKATERFSVPQINDYPLVITAVGKSSNDNDLDFFKTDLV